MLRLTGTRAQVCSEVPAAFPMSTPAATCPPNPATRLHRIAPDQTLPSPRQFETPCTVCMRKVRRDLHWVGVCRKRALTLQLCWTAQGCGLQARQRAEHKLLIYLQGEERTCSSVRRTTHSCTSSTCSLKLLSSRQDHRDHDHSPQKCVTRRADDRKRPLATRRPPWTLRTGSGGVGMRQSVIHLSRDRSILQQRQRRVEEHPLHALVA